MEILKQRDTFHDKSVKVKIKIDDERTVNIIKNKSFCEDYAELGMEETDVEWWPAGNKTKKILDEMTEEEKGKFNELVNSIEIF